MGWTRYRSPFMWALHTQESNMEPRIIIVGGLPGTGKTTISKRFSESIGAPVYTKDELEAVIVKGGLSNFENLRGVGYELLKTISLNNLNQGISSILDCIFPEHRVTAYWQQIISKPIKYIECICPDETLHRTRLEARRRGIDGWYELTWEQVQEIKKQYQPFQESRLILNLADDLNENTKKALKYTNA